MNNKEFDQLVRDAAPKDLTTLDLDYAIEFYRYQDRMERRFLGECMQLASRFKMFRINMVKEFNAQEELRKEAEAAEAAEAAETTEAVEETVEEPSE